MPRDPTVAAANRLAAEWDKKAREQKKKERQLKQEARDRGEDVSGDDDDDDDDGEVAADVDWGVLEDEDMLTSANPPLQGPFAFHAEGSELVEAGESAASHGVPAGDRWEEEGGPAAADPAVMVERSGSGAVPPVVRETSPPASEQGAGSKRPRPDELGQGPGGSSPKRFRRPKASA